MRTFNFVFLLLCLMMQGCSSAGEISPYEVAIRETKKLIDKQELDLSFKYVKIFRYYSTDSGEIYRLSTGNNPLSIGCHFPPHNIIPYKGYNICYYDSYNKHNLSPKDLRLYLKDENLPLTDVIFHFTDRGGDSEWMYYLGVSKDGTSHSLVRLYSQLRRNYRPYLYPSLRKYLFGTSYNEKTLFVFSYDSILVDEQFKPESCLRDHIEGLIACELFIPETCNYSLINQILSPSKAEFMTVNGKDTLRYTFEPSFYPNFNQLYLKTLKDCSSFFQHLPTDNTLHYLDSLVHYHTYCIIKSDGRSERIPIAYFEANYIHEIRKESKGERRCIMTVKRKGINDWFDLNIDSEEQWEKN